MKRLTALGTAAASYLALAAPVFAGEVDPCPGALEQVCKSNVDFGSLVSLALSWILIFAVIIAVIFLIWGGIKWITSGGDKGKVESARGTIIGAIIGLIIALAAYIIINLVTNTLFGFGLSGLTLPGVN